MKFSLFICLYISESYLILDNTNVSWELIYSDFSLFDLAYLKNLLFFKLALCESQYSNIPQYTFNLVDISKLTNVHQDFISNPSWWRRGSYIMVYSPYQTIFYYIKPIYIVPFTGVLLVLFKNITSRGLDLTWGKTSANNLSFCFSYICNVMNRLSRLFLNLLRKLINYLKKRAFNKIKTSKPNIIKNIPVLSHLRSIFVFPVHSINTDNKTTINRIDTFDSTNIYSFTIINYILNINRGIPVNIPSQPLGVLDSAIDRINSNIVNLMARINRELSIWNNYVATVLRDESITIYQDAYSNTRFSHPPNIAPGRIEQLQRIVNMRTVPIIGLFPDLADMVAELYFLLWQIRQIDPHYAFYVECIIHEIHTLIAMAQGMYFISDFNERLITRLYSLLFPPESGPKTGSKRKNSDADLGDGDKFSKKKKEDFDDPGNSSAIF